MSLSKSEQIERDFALEVVRDLREAGYESLWAGGSVRDALLGKTPKDYDIATSAEPADVRNVFGRGRTIPVGASFGVITVLPVKGSKASPIEVATFRSDGKYLDGRRPADVCFTNAEEDAKRRDFTINGMFYDPIEEEVIDYVGGEEDIAKQRVRAIGDPERRFAEDRLRMLRAVRFSSTLGFAIEASTADAVRKHAPAIKEVSPERIGMELRRMLVDKNRRHALELLKEVRLLQHVLPIVCDYEKGQLRMTLSRLERLHSPTAPLALATLLSVTEQPEIASKLARDLKWTSKESDRAGWLVEHQFDLRDAKERRWSEVQPLLSHEGGQELVQLDQAINGQSDSVTDFCLTKLDLPKEELDPPPLVVGADLIQAGLKPGPEFKSLLAQARASQLDGEVDNKEQALRKLGLTE